MKEEEKFRTALIPRNIMTKYSSQLIDQNKTSFSARQTYACDGADIGKPAVVDHSNLKWLQKSISPGLLLLRHRKKMAYFEG